MGVQVETTNDSRPFILGGIAYYEDQGTFLQDAERVDPIAPFTLLARIGASGKIVPLTDVAAIDGSAIPYGIYCGEAIAAADLVAGDVAAGPILTGGSAVMVDRSRVVFENVGGASAIITVDIDIRSVRDRLRDLGINLAETESI